MWTEKWVVVRETEGVLNGFLEGSLGYGIALETGWVDALGCIDGVL